MFKIIWEDFKKAPLWVKIVSIAVIAVILLLTYLLAAYIVKEVFATLKTYAPYIAAVVAAVVAVVGFLIYGKYIKKPPDAPTAGAGITGGKALSLLLIALPLLHHMVQGRASFY